MFRPMAITMACALFGALVYAVLFFPAVLVALVPPAKGHGPGWLERLGKAYRRALPSIVRHRWLLLASSLGIFWLSAWLFGRQGAAHAEVSGPAGTVEVVQRARFGM